MLPFGDPGAELGAGVGCIIFEEGRSQSESDLILTREDGGTKTTR
jgi:hypothetical protein